MAVKNKKEISVVCMQRTTGDRICHLLNRGGTSIFRCIRAVIFFLPRSKRPRRAARVSIWVGLMSWGGRMNDKIHMNKTILHTCFSLLREKGACPEGYRKLAKHLGGVEKFGEGTPINILTVLESNGINDAIWSLRATEEYSLGICRRLAIEFAREVLPIFEIMCPGDDRPRAVIIAAEDFSERRIGEATLKKARDAAAYAAVFAANAAYAAVFAANAADAANAAVFAADAAAADDDGADAAYAAAYAAADAAANAAYAAANAAVFAANAAAADAAAADAA